MSEFRIFTAAFFLALLSGGWVAAQHCAPISESYLGGIRLSRNDEGLVLDLQYCKTGGSSKAAYQAYLLAYSDVNSQQLSQLTPQQALERKLVTIIGTQVTKLDERGRYPFVWELKTEQLVEELRAAGVISAERVDDVGGWKNYKDQIRLAIFIPFLEDRTYSTLEGLPEDRHECNYADEAALLFERLPYELSVCFGIVQAVRLEEGVHYLQINGHRPPGEKAK